jgi:uncharacterized protein
MFFVNKQKKVELLLEEYRQKVLLCLEQFEKSFRQYFDNNDRDVLKQNLTAVSGSESAADDIRREIEVMMYSKAMFPESRGDILGLLEAMDRIPNQAEDVTTTLHNQHISVRQEYKASIINLIGICIRCVEAMIDGASKLFSDFTNATVAVGKIDELESEADIVENALIEQIFASDMDGFSKILLRDLIRRVAAISDRAENVGDRIRLIVAKRGV